MLWRAGSGIADHIAWHIRCLSWMVNHTRTVTGTPHIESVSTESQTKLVPTISYYNCMWMCIPRVGSCCRGICSWAWSVTLFQYISLHFSHLSPSILVLRGPTICPWSSMRCQGKWSPGQSTPAFPAKVGSRLCSQDGRWAGMVTLTWYCKVGSTGPGVNVSSAFVGR